MSYVAALDEDSRRLAQPWPNMRPRDASTILLVDRAGPEPRVLMGRRHARQIFMPDKYVFPGGSVDPYDARVQTARGLRPEVERRLLARSRRATPARARAYAMAAVRELAEETGLLIGSTDAPSRPLGHPHWRPFAEAGLLPALDELAFIARAVTPPGRPRRFDTRFFAADARLVAGRVEGLVGPDAELTEVVWVTLAEARDLDLPRVTRVVLDDLERFIDEGYAPARPVPFYKPANDRMRREEL